MTPTMPTMSSWERRPSGLLVPGGTQRRKHDKPIAVDFFAGAGGFSLGFHQAGWHVAAAIEWDLTAAATYLCNLGGPGTVVHFDDPTRVPAWEQYAGNEQRRWVRCGAPHGFSEAGTGWIANHDALPVEHFWIADVRNLTGAEIVDALGMRPGEVDAVIGGPPCQGFSAMGKRNVYDSRNSLVFEFARLILEINPKTFVMENVPGMLSMVTPEGMPVIDAFCRVLADAGFAAHDALKRALKHQAAFAGLRDDHLASAGADPEPGPADDAEPEQLGLFGEVA